MITDDLGYPKDPIGLRFMHINDTIVEALGVDSNDPERWFWGSLTTSNTPGRRKEGPRTMLYPNVCTAEQTSTYLRKMWKPLLDILAKSGGTLRYLPETQNFALANGKIFGTRFNMDRMHILLNIGAFHLSDPATQTFTLTAPK